MAGRRALSSSPPPPRDQLNAGVLLLVIAALTNQLAMAALPSTVLTNPIGPDPQQGASVASSQAKRALHTITSSNEVIPGNESKVSPVQQLPEYWGTTQAAAQESNLFTTKLSSGVVTPLWPTAGTTTVSSTSHPSSASGGGTGAPTSTTTNGIVDRKTVVEHRNILVGGEYPIG